MHSYEDLALSAGFSRAVYLENLTLVCQPELRAFCNPRQCPRYGKNWVCPPGCGTLDACREKLQRFRQGLLVQSVTDLTPPTAPETYEALTRSHGRRLKGLLDDLRPEAAAVLALSYGGCSLCERCTYPEPCIHPDERMDSLSAFGIDVEALCKTGGLPYSFRPDKLYLTALIMIDPAE